MKRRAFVALSAAAMVGEMQDGPWVPLATTWAPGAAFAWLDRWPRRP